MDEKLAEIPLAKGRFEVFYRQADGQVIGRLTIGTSIGLISRVLEMTKATRYTDDVAAVPHATGRVRANLSIAPFDFASAALNEIGQDAVASGVEYMGSIGAFESDDVHAALHTIFKAALGDTSSRQYMADLGALSHASGNMEFNAIQSAIRSRPLDNDGSDKLSAMTPDQLTTQSAVFLKAYGLIKDALPALTADMERMVGFLRQGDLTAAEEAMSKRMIARYQGGPPPAPKPSGNGGNGHSHEPLPDHAEAVAQYTSGGCPINVGKYRACVGCDCPDPCAADCACDCGCKR